MPRTSPPKISVLMSVYNGEKYLALAIESILHQSFPDFEFVIINDGSNDRTVEIVRSFADARIHLIEQSNMGLSASLNKGVDLCQGEYIARMDADDISRPRRLEIQAQYLDAHPDCALVGSAVQVIDGEGKNKWIMIHSRTELETLWFLLFDSPFIHSSVMLRRSVLAQEGGYSQEPAFCFTEDYELWSRLARKFPVANLDEILMDYRDNLAGVSHSKRDEQEKQSLGISAANLSCLTGNPVSIEEARLFRPDMFFKPENKILTAPKLILAAQKILDVYQVFRENFADRFVEETGTQGVIKDQIAYVLINSARLLAGLREFRSGLSLLKEAISMKPGLVFEFRAWKMLGKFILGR